MPERLIIGISGSSGSLLAIRILQVLKAMNFDLHVVVTDTAKKLLEHETNYNFDDIVKMGLTVYANEDLFAPIASGSFLTLGMAIIPCSMKTLAGVACGYSSNLLLRAADVCLKERRKLVLMTRETPLSLIHIENMRTVTMAGGIILPPVFTMYSRPQKIEDMVDNLIGRVLDVMAIPNAIYPRWGLSKVNIFPPE